LSDHETARAIALNLLDIGDPLDESRVRNAAEVAVRAMLDQGPNHVVDIEKLVRELEANLNVIIGAASTLTEDSGNHVPWLQERRGEIEWSFSRRYDRFLREKKGWAIRTLQRSEELTDQLVGLIEDPNRKELWDRRGMVVGQVQSGKTSNYIALICKAADAGYKFIVVLTGGTNSLRAQTQLRIDEGFIGWDTRLNLAVDANNKPVGVGTLLGEQGLRPIPSTNAEEMGDFSLKIANQFNVRLGGDPVIMVIKKNGSVLRTLTRWARSLSPVGPNIPIPNVPFLMIDDEADYASVNTKPTGKKKQTDEESDPTVINQRIRQLLNTFESKAYIGYTATPFANIFIEPDQKSTRFGEDLFPRDFLINLPVPSNHLGPSKVFGLREDQEANIEPVEPLPLVRIVQDHEDEIPNTHKKDLVVSSLPDSLKTAIRAFIITCAVRYARGQSNEHNSMLVHVTRFVNVQSHIAELVGFELRDLQNRIRYGDGNSPVTIFDELESLWKEDFQPTSAKLPLIDPELAIGCTDVSWAQVKEHLIASSQRILIKKINGSVQDALDYWDHPEGLSAIAIGGDKLSRGLTLEGLSVSYYLRASKMYDTLLQMGRWFGYRPGYTDLCRLYITDELVEFYTYITMASEELRQEINIMSDRGMSPKQFGLRVRNHPAGLHITAANKMRKGIKMSLSYAGSRSETISFDTEPKIIKQNFDQVDTFLKRSTSVPQMKNGNWVWSGISGEDVADLLSSMKVHDSSRKARGDLLSLYIKSQMAKGGLVDWTIALISGSGQQPIEIGGQLVSPSIRSQSPVDAVDGKDVYRIRVLVSPSDESIDLAKPERDHAMELTMDHFKQNQEGTRYQTEPKIPGGLQIRYKRIKSKGLLLLYTLQEPNSANVPYVGFAASFPFTDDDTPVEYTVNSTYWEGDEIDE